MLKQYDETRIEEYGKVIIDVAEDAEISISGKLHLGYNIRKQSEAETYLKLHNKSKLYVSGEFKAFLAILIVDVLSHAKIILELAMDVQLQEMYLYTIAIFI